MKSLKKLTKQIIINYCKNYGHKYDLNNINNINNKDISAMNNDQDNFIINLGKLNAKKRKRDKKIKFDLDGNFSPNNTNSNNEKITYPKKTILKNRLERASNDNISRLSVDNSPSMKKNNFKDSIAFSRKSDMIIKINGKKMTRINQFNQMNKMKTLSNNYRNNNNFIVPSNNKFSNTIAVKFPNNAINSPINKVNKNRINNDRYLLIKLVIKK